MAVGGTWLVTYSLRGEDEGAGPLERLYAANVIPLRSFQSIPELTGECEGELSFTKKNVGVRKYDKESKTDSRTGIN